MLKIAKLTCLCKAGMSAMFTMFTMLTILVEHFGMLTFATSPKHKVQMRLMGMTLACRYICHDLLVLDGLKL